MYRSHRRFAVLAIIFAALLGMSASVTAASQASQAERDSEQSTWDQVTQVGIIHTYFDAVFNDLDADAAAILVEEGAVIETPLGVFTGPQGLIEFLSVLHRANPDAEFALANVTIADTGMAIEWNMTASSYVTDPNEVATAVLVERSGTATIGFDGYVVSAASFDYETAISPLPGQETAGMAPFAERPGQTNF